VLAGRGRSGPAAARTSNSRAEGRVGRRGSAVAELHHGLLGPGFSSEATGDLSRVQGVLQHAREGDRERDAIAGVATGFPESAGAAVSRQ